MFHKDYSQLQLFLDLKYSLTEATVSRTKKELKDGRDLTKKTIGFTLHE